MFRLTDEQAIDATIHAGKARFCNHSCDPNCLATQDVSRESGDVTRHRLFLFSKERIFPGDEITYDYSFPADEKPMICNCGSAGCRGTLNVFPVPDVRPSKRARDIDGKSSGETATGRSRIRAKGVGPLATAQLGKAGGGKPVESLTPSTNPSTTKPEAPKPSPSPSLTPSVPPAGRPESQSMSLSPSL